MTLATAHQYKEPWPSEVRERALQLLLEGYSLRQVSRILKGRYGNAPEVGTIWEWRNQSDVTEQLDKNERAMALRLDRLIERKLDKVENDIGSVRLQELAIPRGIYTDKQFKRADLALKERDNRQFSELLQAIKDRADSLTIEVKAKPVAGFVQETQIEPSHETKLISEPQDEVQST